MAAPELVDSETNFQPTWYDEEAAELAQDAKARDSRLMEKETKKMKMK